MPRLFKGASSLSMVISDISGPQHSNPLPLFIFIRYLFRFVIQRSLGITLEHITLGMLALFLSMSLAGRGINIA